MTNTEAYELARQWCASNDTGHQPHLQYPWVQDMGGASCMVACDGVSAVWVRLEDSTEPGRYSAPGVRMPPDPEIHTPDLHRIVPPNLWGVDVTGIMQQARTLALTVPKSELRFKRAADRAVIGVTHNDDVILHRRKKTTGPQLTPVRFCLAAELVARLPEIVTAMQYEGNHGPILMTHGPHVGSVLMPMRGWG